MLTHSLKLKKPLACIDLETTGLSISKDRIIEICIAKANIDGTVSVKTKRIKPLDEQGNTMPIPPETSMIHGIYDADVADCPSFKQVAVSMAEFLEGADLAGFNSNKFDIPMLVEEFLRAGNTNFDVAGRNCVDVQKIYHLMEPRNLSAAFKFYCNKELTNAHSAEADTLATLEILDAQVKRYEGVKVKNQKGEEIEPIHNDMGALNEITSKDLVDFAQRLTKNDKGETVFNFGKHNGKRVIDVLKVESSYYKWMMEGDFPLDTKRKLTEIKLGKRI
jgi:DNA polymerase III subunit epsilon